MILNNDCSHNTVDITLGSDCSNTIELETHQELEVQAKCQLDEKPAKQSKEELPQLKVHSSVETGNSIVASVGLKTVGENELELLDNNNVKLPKKTKKRKKTKQEPNDKYLSHLINLDRKIKSNVNSIKHQLSEKLSDTGKRASILADQFITSIKDSPANIKEQLSFSNSEHRRRELNLKTTRKSSSEDKINSTFTIVSDNNNLPLDSIQNHQTNDKAKLFSLIYKHQQPNGQPVITKQPTSTGGLQVPLRNPQLLGGGSDSSIAVATSSQSLNISIVESADRTASECSKSFQSSKLDNCQDSVKKLDQTQTCDNHNRDVDADRGIQQLDNCVELAEYAKEVEQKCPDNPDKQDQGFETKSKMELKTKSELAEGLQAKPKIRKRRKRKTRVQMNVALPSSDEDNQ